MKRNSKSLKGRATEHNIAQLEPTSQPSRMDVALEAVFKHHSQKRDASCFASAYEFIMKLHGEIAPNDYPLQSDPSNDGRGFEFNRFLSKYGFRQAPKSPAAYPEAMNLIRDQLSLNTNPIISLFSVDTQGVARAHAVVAFEKEGQILLADPEKKGFQTNDTQQTESLIQQTIEFRSEKFVHILTYSKEAAPTPGKDS